MYVLCVCMYVRMCVCVCVCYGKYYLKKSEQQVPVIKLSHWQFAVHLTDLGGKQPLEIQKPSYQSPQSSVRPIDGWTQSRDAYSK